MRPLALFVPPALRRWLRRAVGRGPRNFKRRSPSQLAQDVQEALLRVNAARQTIARLDLECRELRILEIGPGYNFGPLLLLAGQGALVTAADRFLVSWDDAYHPAFYRALRESWPEPTPVLDRVIAERGYGDALTLLPEPAEDLKSIADATIDLVLSTSVLEHVSDLPAACRELARITHIGGFNLHDIDFRWHRVRFVRPLDFLLHSERRFQRDFCADHGECGNRWRASEVTAMFRSVGFAVVHMTPHMVTEPEQLAAFVPKLRRSRSPYRGWPEDELGILTATFELQRTDDPALRARGAAEVASHDRRKIGASLRA